MPVLYDSCVYVCVCLPAHNVSPFWKVNKVHREENICFPICGVVASLRCLEPKQLVPLDTVTVGTPHVWLPHRKR